MKIDKNKLESKVSNPITFSKFKKETYCEVQAFPRYYKLTKF